LSRVHGELLPRAARKLTPFQVSQKPAERVKSCLYFPSENAAKSDQKRRTGIIGMAGVITY